MRRTKIVCTIGPASSSPEVMSQLVAAGLDMARINMSHGDHATHRKAIEEVRFAAQAQGRRVPVLVDLCGPKIRVGDLTQPIELKPGSNIVIAPEAHAQPGDIPTSYEGFAGDVSAGERVLLDDGLIELRGVESDGRRVTLEVVRGGLLKSRKGINLPDVDVAAPSMTAKDREDLQFALEMGAEYISLSFVRRAADVRELKELVQGRALVVAKIEKAQAMRNLDSILLEADGVMVARGDLGVELPFEEVPLAQKKIIRRANHLARPVITATQMLESMIENPRPTRAEASDVANAILDGTDCVMLSGETAVGRYPVEALSALVSIAHEIEASDALLLDEVREIRHQPGARGGATAREHAVGSASVRATYDLDAPAVLTITRSGFSARLVSSYRPSVPIFAICTDPITCSQLAAVWGVYPVLATEEEVSYESLASFGKRIVVDMGIGRPGQSIVVTAGFPFHIAGTTNTLRVEQL
jgi:pyruvate kinase